MGGKYGGLLFLKSVPAQNFSRSHALVQVGKTHWGKAVGEKGKTKGACSRVATCAFHQLILATFVRVMHILPRFIPRK
jgi:hypothetical protein